MSRKINAFCPEVMKVLTLCVSTALLAGFDFSKPVVAKTKKKSSEIERLQDENERLRRQIEQLQAAVAIPVKQPSGTRVNQDNPFSAKEITRIDSAGGSAGASTAGGMKCGAAMKGSSKRVEMKCGATMKAGEMSCGGRSNFTMNPVFGGLDEFWTMPEDSFMLNVKWMHNQQGGLQQGTTPYNPYTTAVPNGGGMKYMMPPTDMTMDMFMFMPMWGVTENLTLMAMVNYMYMGMGMNMNMMDHYSPSAPMNVGGISDTNLDVIYKLPWIENLVGTIQLNLPTGSTQQMYNPAGMGIQGYCPSKMGGPGCLKWNNPVSYNMQLGAGVVGIMPALTYNWFADDNEYNAGGQVSGTAWLGTNDGWSPGNNIKISLWGQKSWDKNWTSWVRTNYLITMGLAGCSSAISGSCVSPNGMDGVGTLMPAFNPENYGSQVGTVMVGSSWTRNGFSLGLEGGVPYYQNFNGVQQMNSYQIWSGASYMW